MQGSLADWRALDYTESMFTAKAPLLIIKDQAHVKVLAETMVRFWSKRGVSVPCCLASTPTETLFDLAHDRDVLIVLGGDGTLVSMARQLQPLDLPFFAFNFGRVGFLAEWMPAMWEEAFAALLAGELELQTHSGISWSLIHGDSSPKQAMADSYVQGLVSSQTQTGFAVNDVVLGRGRLARVVPLEISLNDTFLANVRADGLIVSTPLGASGYNFSAGGALVHPAVDALCLTAISPIQHAFSSMILPPDARISLALSEALRHPDLDVFVTVDGQEGFAFGEHDQLHIELMPKALRFVSASSDTYIARLQQRNFLHA